MLDWMKLDWMTRRESIASSMPESQAETAKPRGRAMAGTYKLLHTYLDNRYASTVVLTFGEIEDLLGFALPDQARLHTEWWTDVETQAGPRHTDSWLLASRTAVPNLRARTVVFEREP